MPKFTKAEIEAMTTSELETICRSTKPDGVFAGEVAWAEAELRKRSPRSFAHNQNTPAGVEYRVVYHMAGEQHDAKTFYSKKKYEAFNHAYIARHLHGYDCVTVQAMAITTLDTFDRDVL
jgi:hypothetical protein